MNLRIILLSMMLSSFYCRATAQDLSVYRWEKRLVILLAEELDNPQITKQLDILNSDSTGLTERKLMIISSTPTVVKREFPYAWINPERSGSLFRQFHQEGSFEFVLVGLDGGVKLRRQEVISLKELYRIIDSMPMRAAEKRTKNN